MLAALEGANAEFTFMGLELAARTIHNAADVDDTKQCGSARQLLSDDLMQRGPRMNDAVTESQRTAIRLSLLASILLIAALSASVLVSGREFIQFLILGWASAKWQVVATYVAWVGTMVVALVFAVNALRKRASLPAPKPRFPLIVFWMTSATVVLSLIAAGWGLFLILIASGMH